jgi:hypothetical protein
MWDLGFGIWDLGFGIWNFFLCGLSGNLCGLCVKIELLTLKRCINNNSEVSIPANFGILK